MAIRYLAFILILALVPHFGTSTQAESSADNLPTLQIVTEGLRPVSYVDPATGEMAGFASEYIKDIIALTDVDYQYNVFPWTRTYKIAQTTPNVLVILIARTERREESFIWFETVISLDFYLYGLENRRSEITNSEEDYKNSRVGVIRNDFNHEEIEANGFTNIIAAENNRVLIDLLTKGRVDFIVTSVGALKYFDIGYYAAELDLFKATPLAFLNTDIYYAFSLGTDPRIIAQFKQAAKILREDPAYIKPDIDCCIK